MSSKPDLITGLMIKYARREKLTDEEMRILEEWWQQSPEHRRLAEQFGDEDWVRAELAKMKPAPMKEMWEGINQYLDDIGAPDDRAHPTEWEEETVSRLPGTRWARPLAVAAVAVMCVTAVWVLVGNRGPRTDGQGSAAKVASANAKDVKSEPIGKGDAGEDGVLLVAGDGSAVDMNAARMGDTVARIGNVYVKKLDTNQLAVYSGDRNAGGDGWQAVLVGRKRSPYFVRLPDGSNAWLNGGTRLENVGGRTEHHYRLEGKAFFDVTKDKSRPFVIHTPNGCTIEVLGTSFDVEAGKEAEESRVVLLNGALRVRKGGDSAVLHPLQEAVLSTGKMKVQAVSDSAAVVAWVAGARYFHFDNTSFTDAIAAVASWYGYKISNPKGLRGIPITDHLRKDLSPDDVVFKIGEIETGYLHVAVNNRVIYISDKETAIHR